MVFFRSIGANQNRTSKAGLPQFRGKRSEEEVFDRYDRRESFLYQPEK